MNLDEQIIIDLSKDIKIPYSYEIAIKTALKGKHKVSPIQIIRNIILWIMAILGLLCGSFGVYAVTGGTIEGVPAIDWLGIKFSSEYTEYKEEVHEEIKTYNETTVELTGTLASDYVTVLEFDVKLSEEDKKYLRLGEDLSTKKDETDLQEILNEKEENYKLTLNSIKEMYSQRSEEELQEAIDFETQRVGREKEHTKEIYEKIKNYFNILELGFNKKPVEGELDLLADMPHTKDSIYLDGEEIWCRNYETVEKITDNEYKIYHVILLTDDNLKGKTSYNITLKNVILANKGQIKQGKEEMYKGSNLINTPNNARRIDIEGEFSIDVSKAKIMENSKIIKLTDKKSSYKNVTQEIEEINVNPLQTIIRAKTTITGVSSSKRYWYEDEIQNPLWVEFQILDENGKELTSESFETKKILTKGDGTVEEWYPGDVDGGSVYSNGTFELTEYIIVEKSNTNKIKIIPSFQNLERKTRQEKYHTLAPIEIDLT